LLVRPLRNWLKDNWPALVLFGLLAVAFSLRAYGLDWDQGFFFHPDERQILMVVGGLSWPKNLPLLFSSQSPLNPHFFAYGSFPIYLLRLVSSLVALWRAEWASITGFYLLGRLLSVSFDAITVYATYLLAGKVYERRVAVLAAALVTFTVLHIQLAHFYTVDTILTPLVLLAVSKAVDVARGRRLRDGAWLGILFGIALATKVSVLPLAVVVLVAWLVSAWPVQPNQGHMPLKLRAAWRQVRRKVFLTFALALVCFVLLEPYALIDAYHFAQGVAQEVAMSQGWVDFPYTRQYAGSLPYLYQARQILLYAMGIPLGLFGLSGLLCLGLHLRQQPSGDEVVLASWPLLYALLQGAAYAKFIRYMLPLLPFLCIAGAIMWVRAWDTVRTSTATSSRRQAARFALIVVLCVVLLSTMFYAISFLNVYRQTHPWIQASLWLCQHVREGSTIMVEYWDDPLPLRSAIEGGGCPKEYIFFTLDLHAPDTETKLEHLLNGIEASDYIVLSSQRLYAPISRLATRYPLSSQYYQQLFAGRLGFELVAAPAVYPQLAGVILLDNPRAGLPLATPPLLTTSRPQGLVFDLGQADESFTVYDHPQPLIFAKVSRLSRQELQALLRATTRTPAYQDTKQF